MSVVKFYPANAAENPDNVLEQAIGALESVLVVGYDKHGNLDARASLNLDEEEIIFMLEMFKHKLFNGDYQE